ncbi:hypothetical protein M430DRAFT_184356 [Amorphotheca resinae ATCC 22711]|uniref:Uncharacterized protein n=1 Tax=Amorphotheca resinae ATCC 22711 TaxID=857342 RepID=A0A2T3AS66_AMORE|nr:hypothetical protein M430DRAFT_184356 [Amorphotheca resinae ATCC 22711]PSS09219.1 hypothetical protein M430DRAFT_184356 [Amorphotheca resinae ATCC 22711]
MIAILQIFFPFCFPTRILRQNRPGIELRYIPYTHSHNCITQRKPAFPHLPPSVRLTLLFSIIYFPVLVPSR